MCPKSLYLKAIPFFFAFELCPVVRAEEPRPERRLVWHAEPSTDVAHDSADRDRREVDRGAASAVEDGSLKPFTMSASISSTEAVAQTFAGYDSATQSIRARSAAEARATEFLAFRVEYAHGPGTSGDDDVSFGARIQLLRERTHGVDAGAGFFYQPKDFRGEGDFVGALLIGRHFGRLGLFGNALFGADSEGDDESAEVRAGAGYRVTSAFRIGFDARGRANLSTDSKRFGARLVEWELQAGPLASLALGPFALQGVAGPSLLRLSDPGNGAGRVKSGVQAMAGVGAAF